MAKLLDGCAGITREAPEDGLTFPLVHEILEPLAQVYKVVAKSLVGPATDPPSLVR